MGKEARTAPAEPTGAGVITDTAIGEKLRCAMVLGAFAGMAVGVLNVLAVGYRWKLADYFDILDFPFLSLDTNRIPVKWYNLGPTADVDIYGPGLLCGIICYWTFIGWFLGSLFCLVRAGVIIDVVREKAGRWVLFFGACGGMFIGCLNFLAASNGWEELERCFRGLDGPIDWLLSDTQFDFLAFLPAGPSTRFVGLHVALIIYWAVIGLLVAWLVCAVWIVGKRIAAGKDPLSSGMETP